MNIQLVPSFIHPLGRKFIVGFVLASLVFPVACAKREAPTPASATPTPDEIIATVNDRPVPRKLYEMFMQNAREEFGLSEATEEGQRKLADLREGIVSELIDRALIAEEAGRRNLPLTPERLSATEAREITKLGGERAFDAYLQNHNLSREEYRAIVRDLLSGELMTEEAGRAATVSEREIKTYYDAHRKDESQQLPERITASHILINARPQTIAQGLQQEKNLTGDALAAAVREELERRRQKAAEVRREATRKGADFAALARAHSDDPATRERGGDLGKFARGAHTGAFDEAAFRLKVGGISDVVETEYGHHIIKLRGREPARPVSLAEATPEIRRRLLAQKQAQLLSNWLKEARGKANVRIKEDYRTGALQNFPAL